MKVSKKGDFKKKNLTKKGSVTKIRPKKEQVFVVAQEIKYARLLAGNEKSTRDRVLKALKKWLTNCFEKGYEFKEEDFTRVWKGLFYAVWMSDKPLIQEELCENIASILDVFPAEQLKHAMLMTKAGFRMLATEWYGIDQHRMDKFLMLVRRYLRGSLRCLRRCDWSLDSCEKYAKMLSGPDSLFALQTPHYARNATSMLLHIMDCFLEELAKVSEGDIGGASVAALLRPFVTYTCAGAGGGAVCAGARRLLTALVRQAPLALSYEEKTRAWRQMGCPAGGPDALELVSDGEDATCDEDTELAEDGVSALDPRAGRVDVVLPLVPVPAELLASMLRDMLANTGHKAHKRIKICLQRFESLAAGRCPLPVSPSSPGPAPGGAALRPARSVRALRALDSKIKHDTDELKLRGLSRKHRKRLLRKTRAGLSIVEDVPTQHAHAQAHAHAHKQKRKNGEWLVESTAETKEKDSSDKENQNKKKNKTNKRKLEIQQNGDVANKKVKISEQRAKKDNIKEIISKKKDLKGERKIKEKNTNKPAPKLQHDTLRTDPSNTRTKHKVDRDSAHKVKQIDSSKVQKVKEIDTRKTQNESPKCEADKNTVIHKATDIRSKRRLTPKVESPKVLINKLKNFQKQIKKEKKDKSQAEIKFQKDIKKSMLETPKKVKFMLKNNSMQQPVDYYKSVRLSPSIPFDSAKKPTKTNLKPSTPSPINPFFKKKLRVKLERC